jgi:glycosyltransferase involved in cell wall biosynthesis
MAAVMAESMPSRDDPVVTIVITTKDRPSTVGAAVASALAQSHARVEVIVVDDGGRKPYEAGHEAGGRVRTIALPRSVGPSAARNAALATAAGTWITFLDDDDVLPSDAIEVGLRAATASTLPTPVAVVGIRELIDEAGLVRRRYLPPTLPRGANWYMSDKSGRSRLVHNSLLAPIDALRRIGGFDDALRSWQHDDLFQRLLKVCSLQGTDHVTYVGLAPDPSRQHLSLDHSVVVRDLEHAAMKHAADLDRHAKARMQAAIAMNALEAGDHRTAVRSSMRALALHRLGGRSFGRALLCLIGPAGFRALRWFGRRLRARR